MTRPPGRLTVAGLGAGLIAVLATSGTYAVTAGSATTIKACAAKSNGALRIATHCNNSERSVVWNAAGRRGPAGPGARLLTYDSTPSTAVASPHRVGRIGPWQLYGSCSINPRGTVTAAVYYSGPATTLDEVDTNSEAGPSSTSLVRTVQRGTEKAMSPQIIGGSESYSGGYSTEAMANTWISRAGLLSQSLIATTTSVAFGDATNHCHWSSVTVPLAKG
jgi:hypothetical protein